MRAEPAAMDAEPAAMGSSDSSGASNCHRNSIALARLHPPYIRFDAARGGRPGSGSNTYFVGTFA